MRRKLNINTLAFSDTNGKKTTADQVPRVSENSSMLPKGAGSSTSAGAQTPDRSGELSVPITPKLGERTEPSNTPRGGTMSTPPGGKRTNETKDISSHALAGNDEDPYSLLTEYNEDEKRYNPSAWVHLQKWVNLPHC